jgi:hypothetical protein
MKTLNIFFLILISSIVFVSCEDKEEGFLQVFFKDTEVLNFGGVFFTDVRESTITNASVTFSGNATISGGNNTITQTGICYSQSNSMPTIFDQYISSSSYSYSTFATIECVLNGLTANTLYYYRAYVLTNEGNYIYEQLTHSFTTLSKQEPSVTTDEVTVFTSNSATFTGKIEANGQSISYSGFCYSTTNATPTYFDNRTPYNYYQGEISATLTNLLPNTTYYVRTYTYYYDLSTFTYSYVYGKTVSFKTPALVVDYTNYYVFRRFHKQHKRLEYWHLYLFKWH